ncbi:MAG: MFS transporter [Elusimicrobia bacterium]|nr:MFS transporter [Elusimicrobiota bacterium]
MQRKNDLLTATSLLLISSLILTSPGLGFYEALAQSPILAPSGGKPVRQVRVAASIPLQAAIKNLLYAPTHIQNFPASADAYFLQHLLPYVSVPDAEKQAVLERILLQQKRLDLSGPANRNRPDTHPLSSFLRLPPLLQAEPGSYAETAAKTKELSAEEGKTYWDRKVGELFLESFLPGAEGISLEQGRVLPGNTLRAGGESQAKLRSSAAMPSVLAKGNPDSPPGGKETKPPSVPPSQTGGESPEPQDGFFKRSATLLGAAALGALAAGGLHFGAIEYLNPLILSLVDPSSSPVFGFVPGASFWVTAGLFFFPVFFFFNTRTAIRLLQKGTPGLQKPRFLYGLALGAGSFAAGLTMASIGLSGIWALLTSLPAIPIPSMPQLTPGALLALIAIPAMTTISFFFKHILNAAQYGVGIRLQSISRAVRLAFQIWAAAAMVFLFLSDYTAPTAFYGNVMLLWSLIGGGKLFPFLWAGGTVYVASQGFLTPWTFPWLMVSAIYGAYGTEKLLARFLPDRGGKLPDPWADFEAPQKNPDSLWWRIQELWRKIRNHYTVVTLTTVATLGAFSFMMGLYIFGLDQWRSALLPGMAMAVLGALISQWLVVKLFGAVPVDKEKTPEAHRILTPIMAEVLQAIGGPPLKMLGLIPKGVIGGPNAMATGWRDKSAVILVTEELLEQMSPEEIKGVLAHELRHVRGKHIWSGAIAGGFAASIPAILSLGILGLGQILRVFGKSGREDYNYLKKMTQRLMVEAYRPQFYADPAEFQGLSNKVFPDYAPTYSSRTVRTLSVTTRLTVRALPGALWLLGRFWASFIAQGMQLFVTRNNEDEADKTAGDAVGDLTVAYGLDRLWHLIQETQSQQPKKQGSRLRRFLIRWFIGDDDFEEIQRTHRRLEERIQRRLDAYYRKTGKLPPNHPHRWEQYWQPPGGGGGETPPSGPRAPPTPASIGSSTYRPTHDLLAAIPATGDISEITIPSWNDLGQPPEKEPLESQPEKEPLEQQPQITPQGPPAEKIQEEPPTPTSKDIRHSQIFIFVKMLKQIAIEVYGFAVPIFLLNEYGAALAISYVGIAVTVANILSKFYGGSLADRLSAKKMFIVATTAGALLQILTIFLIDQKLLTLPLFIAVSVFSGVIGPIAYMAGQKWPILLLNKNGKAIERYISKKYWQMEPVGVTMPLAAGLILAHFGMIKTLALAPAAMFLSALLALTLPDKKNTLEKAAPQKPWEGWRVIRKDKQLLLGTIGYVFLWIANGILYSLIAPLFAKHLLGSEEVSYWFTSPYSLGAFLIGLYSMTKFGRRIRTARWVQIAALSLVSLWLLGPVSGLSLQAFGQQIFWGVALLMIFFGITNVAAGMRFDAHLQTRSPKGTEGRVIAFAGILLSAVSMLTMGGLGWIFDHWGSQAIWVLNVVLSALAAFYLYLARQIDKQSGTHQPLSTP